QSLFHRLRPVWPGPEQFHRSWQLLQTPASLHLHDYEFVPTISLRNQHDFTDVPACLDVAVCFPNLIEWESTIDVRFDPTFIDSTQDLAHPVRDLIAFVPQVSGVQSEHAFVTVHHPQRIESRGPQYGLKGA